MSTRWGWFGAPADAAAWLALGVAVALLAAAGWRRTRGVAAGRAAAAGLASGGRPWAALGGLALLSALLSLAYQHHYLRGGPRIIDATSYLLEARTLAAGGLTFALPEPSAALRGRFVVTTPDGLAAGVLFPPGWPALLALAVRAGHPLAAGPLLAAALTALTGLLGWRLAGLAAGAGAGLDPRRVAVLAAAFATLSAALRYHTADPMAHGLAAVLLCGTLLAAFEARAAAGRAALAGAALAGLAAGWLVATRPVTGAVGVALLGAVLLAGRPPRAAGALGPLLAAGLGLLPGVGLLAAHQHALTGAWLGSTQLRYYALADGPPGCFRWGFGAGIGCWHEHGTFLEHRGTDQHGLREALRVTGYRLRWHALDGLNAEPLFLLVPWAALRHARRPGLGWLGPAVLALLAAYAGFYFDGSYPGGGARLLSEALPLEHVLAAALVSELGLALPVLALGLAGFALHGSHEHRALRDREGGRPMFLEADLLPAAARAPLLFVDTDHGHHLAFDPASGRLAARRRHDDHDRLLWERQGRPRALAHHFDFATGAVTVEDLTSRLAAGPARDWRFEAEAEWPPLAVEGGWAHPAPLGAPCASAGAGLRLHAVGAGPVVVAVELPVPAPGRWDVTVRFAHHGPGVATVEAATGPAAARRTHDFSREPCLRLGLGPVALGAERARLTVRADGGGAVLDAVELRGE